MKGRVALGTFVAAGALVALALAFFIGPRASGEPDGLNRVAIDKGFADTETAHALDGVPTAGYALQGVENEQLSTGVAGVIGVVVTFAITAALFVAVRRLRARPTASVSPTG